MPDKIKNAIGKFYLINCHGLKIQHLGNLNPDKKYYVIKSSGLGKGIFSLVLDVLGSLDNAERRNAIPIVDFQDLFMPMIQNEDKAYKENPWTYYFQQPGEQITLEEVYQSQNVIIGLENVSVPAKGLPKNWYSTEVLYDKKYDKWRCMIRKYIRLQPALENRVEQLYNSLFPKDEKVLGVGIRAGYRYSILDIDNLALNHPITYEVEHYIHEIENIMHKWDYNIFFLSVDDSWYREKIVKYFGDKVFCMPRKLKHYFENGELVEGVRKMSGITDIRVHTEEYVVETVLLSKCNALYASMCTTAEMAFFFNGGKYEYCKFGDEKIWNGGR